MHDHDACMKGGQRSMSRHVMFTKNQPRFLRNVKAFSPVNTCSYILYCVMNILIKVVSFNVLIVAESSMIDRTLL